MQRPTRGSRLAIFEREWNTHTKTHPPPICSVAMVSSELARTAVGIIGNVIALILFLSPVPTFMQIVKKGAVEQFSPVPYLATFINCGIWVLYGLPVVHPHSLLVITINGTGFVIETVYLLLFLIYNDRKQRIKVVLIAVGELVFLGVLSALVLTVAHTTKVRSNIVGSIAIVGNIMMYAPPSETLTVTTTNPPSEQNLRVITTSASAACAAAARYQAPPPTAITEPAPENLFAAITARRHRRNQKRWLAWNRLRRKKWKEGRSRKKETKRGPVVWLDQKEEEKRGLGSNWLIGFGL